MNPSASIPPSLVAFALHSSVDGSAGAQLLERLKFDSATSKHESLWVFARNIGAGSWGSTLLSTGKLVECIARSEFIRTQKAEHATLWHVALGRYSTVAAIFKAQEDMRMASLFKRNFALLENKTAASKNACVLVAKHRFVLATAFFYFRRSV